MKVDVIKADVANVACLRAVFAAPLVNKVDDRIANSLDGRDVQFARPRSVRIAPGAEGNSAFVRRLGIAHPKRNCAYAGAVLARKALGKRIRLGINDEVDAPLTVQRDVFAPVLGLQTKTLHSLNVSEIDLMPCTVKAGTINFLAKSVCIRIDNAGKLRYFHLTRCLAALGRAKSALCGYWTYGLLASGQRCVNTQLLLR